MTSSVKNERYQSTAMSTNNPFPNGPLRVEDPSTGIADLNSAIPLVQETKSRASQVYYLWPCYGLYAMAVGMTFAPNLEVRSKIICQSYTLDSNANCDAIPNFKNEVAHLTIILSLITGVLACLTTSYWSAFSDKIGRLPIITLTSAGYFIVNGINAYVSTRLDPNQMYLLYISAAIEGLSGSQSTVMALSHAYASDCTDNGSRAHVFSQLMGILFLGVAAGPALATFITKYTEHFENAFIAASVLSIIMLIISLIIPESLERKSDLDTSLPERQSAAQTIRKMPSIVDNIKKPFSIIAPQRDDNDVIKNVNLLAITLAYVPIVLAIGSVQIKFLYTKFKFDWDVNQLGSFITYVGTVRALALLLIIPLSLETLRRFMKPAIELPTTTIYEDEDEDTINDEILTKSVNQAEIKFDLVLLRFCLAIDAIAYAGLAFSGSVTTFSAFTAMSAFGGGASPSAISSLALLLAPKESESNGAVLGAFSSVQSAGAQIIGPALYGFIYAQSPNSAFMFVIGGTFIASIIATFFVKY
ncbi:hypothetical protein E3Q14_02366 [Wallemia mellicola]|nr:hypothetical protein E3Q14_02366 [Wallemia mellicola]